jgi:hypothetical protein
MPIPEREKWSKIERETDIWQPNPENNRKNQQNRHPPAGVAVRILCQKPVPVKSVSVHSTGVFPRVSKDKKHAGMVFFKSCSGGKQEYKSVSLF